MNRTNINLDSLNVFNLNRYGFISYIQNITQESTGIVPPLDSQLTIRLPCGCQFMWADISLIEEKSYYCFHGHPFISWHNFLPLWP